MKTIKVTIMQSNPWNQTANMEIIATFLMEANKAEASIIQEPRNPDRVKSLCKDGGSIAISFPELHLHGTMKSSFREILHHYQQDHLVILTTAPFLIHSVLEGVNEFEENQFNIQPIEGEF